MASPRLVRPIAIALVIGLLAMAGCHTSAAPKSGAQPSASPRGSLPATPKLSAFEQLLAKLPKFGPAPTAIPIKLTEGAKAPLFYRLPTTQKVAFLTIDDGLVQLPRTSRS